PPVGLDQEGLDLRRVIRRLRSHGGSEYSGTLSGRLREEPDDREPVPGGSDPDPGSGVIAVQALRIQIPILRISVRVGGHWRSEILSRPCREDELPPRAADTRYGPIHPDRVHGPSRTILRAAAQKHPLLLAPERRSDRSRGRGAGRNSRAQRKPRRPAAAKAATPAPLPRQEPARGR